MALTPLDIQNKDFSTCLRGYKREEVDDFLDEIIKNYERMYKENIQLKEQSDVINKELERYHQLEETLHNTLILAKETAEEVKNNAEKEKELVLKEARLQATKIEQDGIEKLKVLNNEYDDLKRQVILFKSKYIHFLDSQLKVLQETDEMGEASLEEIACDKELGDLQGAG